MTNPSNPPEERLHECDRLGLLPVYGRWLEVESDDDLRTVIAHEARVRVMFAVNRLSFGLSLKTDAIAKENMPAEAFQEYRSHSGVLDDLRFAQLELVENVIARMMINAPVTLGTLEEMVCDALVRSDLCCDLAADELVSSRILDTMRELPEFQEEWATLEFARSSVSKKVHPFAGVWPVEDPVDRPVMVAMGQDLNPSSVSDVDHDPGDLGEELGLALENALTMVPGRSVMVVMFDTPEDFEPPNHVSLDPIESKLWTAMLLRKEAKR